MKTRKYLSEGVLSQQMIIKNHFQNPEYKSGDIGLDLKNIILVDNIFHSVQRQVAKRESKANNNKFNFEIATALTHTLNNIEFVYSRNRNEFNFCN